MYSGLTGFTFQPAPAFSSSMQNVSAFILAGHAVNGCSSSQKPAFIAFPSSCVCVPLESHRFKLFFLQMWMSAPAAHVCTVIV